MSDENNNKYQDSELTEAEILLAGIGDENDFQDEEFEDDLTLEGNRPWNRRSRRRMRRLGRNTSASLYRRQALERVHKMSSNVQKKLVNGQAQISDMQYYACAAITGKNCDLIDESINRKLGLTNIDGGKLDKDREFILSGIKFAYDAAAIDGAYTDPIPAAVYNGEFELQLNGKKVIDNMPMAVFYDGVTGYNVNKPYGLYVLNNPKHIRPQQTMELEVKLPATSGGFLKAYLIGTSVKPH